MTVSMKEFNSWLYIYIKPLEKLWDKFIVFFSVKISHVQYEVHTDDGVLIAEMIHGNYIDVGRTLIYFCQLNNVRDDVIQ